MRLTSRLFGRPHRSESSSRESRRSARRRQFRRRAGFEALETRLVLSTFNPLPGAVDGAMDSLRAAITAANANAEDDIIELTAGTYNLTLSGASEDNNASGDLDLTETGHTITMLGAGTDQTIVDASGLLDRVFDVKSDVTVEFVGLTITGGTGESGSGGGIYNAGTLTVRDGQISGNEASKPGNAPREGGGIYNTGNVTLDGTAVSDNNSRTGSAGGIWSDGTVTLTNSVVSRNSVGYAYRDDDAVQRSTQRPVQDRTGDKTLVRDHELLPVPVGDCRGSHLDPCDGPCHALNSDDVTHSDGTLEQQDQSAYKIRHNLL